MVKSLFTTILFLSAAALILAGLYSGLVLVTVSGILLVAALVVGV